MTAWNGSFLQTTVCRVLWRSFKLGHLCCFNLADLLSEQTKNQNISKSNVRLKTVPTDACLFITADHLLINHMNLASSQRKKNSYQFNKLGIVNIFFFFNQHNNGSYSVQKPKDILALMQQRVSHFQIFINTWCCIKHIFGNYIIKPF